MIHELIVALMLGLIGGLIPGPVITAVFTEILQSGYLRSMRIIFIALVTETLVALISLLLLASLGFNEAFFRGLSLAGAVILLWISVSLWKIRSLESGGKVHFGFWKKDISVADIFRNRCAEFQRSLKENGDPAAKVGLSKVLEVDAVYFDRSTIRVVES